MTSITIGSVGDVLTHDNVLSLARTGDGYDFHEFFTPVAPLIRSCDLPLFQQETPLTTDPAAIETGDQGDRHTFNAPAELATALADAGFAGCSTANNHTWDAGIEGVRRTREVLDSAGFGVAGPNPDEPLAHGAMYEVGGVCVAHFAYSYTLDNQSPTVLSGPPQGHEWAAVNVWVLRGPEGIIEDARLARSQGAEVVVVSMHWGVEYAREDGLIRDWATQILESGEVDWIMGNHPHVHQGVECINGRWVTYSQGNFLGGRDAALFQGWPQDTSFAVMQVSRNEVGDVVRQMTIYPLAIDQETRVVYRASPQDHPHTWWHVHRLAHAYGADVTVV